MDLNAGVVVIVDGKTDRLTNGRKTGHLYRTLLKQVQQKQREANSNVCVSERAKCLN